MPNKTNTLPANIKENLNHLASSPPQVLLIEGGNETTRLQTAIYWAQNLNCVEIIEKNSKLHSGYPCENCHICKLISNLEYNDLFIFDGRISNKQDEDNPGLIRALRMEHMRNLKSVTAEAPRGKGKRVVIFQGLTQTREEAMNSILKTLEEPSPFSVFVLLASQREQLLPTLVSRSLCISLPWESSSAYSTTNDEWVVEITEFLNTGKQFLEKIAAKNAIDSKIASNILTNMQAAIVRHMGKIPSHTPIDNFLTSAAFNSQALFDLSNWIDEAQKMLNATVNPVRVLEAFATKVYCLQKNH